MSSSEHEVRRALEARAAEVPVGRADEAGLGRRLVTARRRRRQTRMVGAAIAAVLVLGGASLVAADDPRRDTLVAGPDTSSTRVAEASTTTPETTAVEPVPTLAPVPTTVAPGTSVVAGPGTTTIPKTTSTATPRRPVPDDAVWPAPGATEQFTTATQAATDFARRFLGMGTPQPSPARLSAQGRDATVDIRPLPGGGPTTSVLLRFVDRRGWVVLGCRADRIVLSQPKPGATVTPPLAVRGEAWTFEGNVIVEVRSDGAAAPIGQSFGTGGGDQLRPFEATVTFARPTAPRGALVALEPRVDDGDQGPAAATVVRIAF